MKKALLRIPVFSHLLSQSALLFWLTFVGALFFSGGIQWSENMSFWNGVFAPFSTGIIPCAFFPAALALLATAGIFFRQNSETATFARAPKVFALTILIFLFLNNIFHNWNTIGIFFSFLWIFSALLCVLTVKRIFPLQWCFILVFLLAIGESFLAIWQSLPSVISPSFFAVGSPVLKSISGEVLRASGTFAHPNILAFVLTIVFFALGIVGEKWRKWRYVLLLGILFTFSRTAFVAIILGSMYDIFAIFKNRSVRKSYLPLFALILGIIGIFLRMHFDTISPSNANRISEISASFQVIFAHPWGGIGIGNFPKELAKLGAFFPWELQPVHNIFLLLSVEVGILAGAALFCFFAWLLWQSWKKRNEGYFTILLAISVFALFDHLLLTSLTGAIFGAIAIGAFLQTPKEFEKSGVAYPPPRLNQ